MMILLAAAAAAFDIGLIVWLLAPRAQRWCTPAALATVAIVSGAVAALAPGAPTGVAPIDAALKASLGAGMVVLGSRASGVAIAGAFVVGLAASLGSTFNWAASVTLGLSTATVLSIPRAPLARAASAALLTQLPLHLESGWPQPLTAGAAALVLVPLAVSGARGLDAHQFQRLRTAGLAAGAVLIAGMFMGMAAVLQALPSLRSGERAMSMALESAREGDAVGAGEELRLAARQLAIAEDALSPWWSRPAFAVPLVGQQLRAVETMAATGADMATMGASTLEESDVAGIKIVDGRVPVDRITDLQGPLMRAVRILEQSQARLDAADSPWLAPPLKARLAELRSRVTNGRIQAETTELAVRIAPSLLGEEGHRRFFLAVQNPAEMRATGGIIGNFGEITAVDGRLQLTRFGRSMDLNVGGAPADRVLEGPAEYLERYRNFHPEQVWQNVTASPDFPTVARVIADLYPQSGGQPVDGVISVDPAGLAALLKVVGPIEVAGWPEPITEDNAEQILLHEQYVRYPTIERVGFLSDTAHAIWSRFTTGTLGDIAGFASALHAAAEGKHILLWSPRNVEQHLFDRLGVTGAVPPLTGDHMGVVTQNASGNKIDWFLERHVDYRAVLDEATGDIDAILDIRLRNGAPSRGLPPLVIASSGRARTEPGENLLYLSIYSPWELEGAEVDGRPVGLEAQVELGRRVYSTFLTVPPNSTRHIRLQLSGRLSPAKPYHLDVLRQATIRPDLITTSVEKR